MPNYLNFLISSILLTFVVPIFILVSAAILITSGRPIFFFQERIGLNNKKFILIKFRTMTINNNEHTSKNVTSIGKILRKYSLDEIPNFINIFRGEMNLVGPRPLLVEYMNYYSSTELIRHEVKPGITGLAQINGRNKIDWNEKFKYDINYIKNRSVLLDFKIIFKTFIYVFSSKNNNFNDKIISKKFKG